MLANGGIIMLLSLLLLLFYQARIKGKTLQRTTYSKASTSKPLTPHTQPQQHQQQSIFPFPPPLQPAPVRLQYLLYDNCSHHYCYAMLLLSLILGYVTCSYHYYDRSQYIILHYHGHHNHSLIIPI